ncbi:MAG: FliA/WhiG family RNA polymerase sigma factor [Phycisphaeraceae bacterium]|nr:FliA/WhiG family RNA polymerase sigma factor [Phycisphaeraceae bacterium]
MVPTCAATQQSDNRRKIQQAWMQYKLDRDVDARNELIEHYLPIVKYHADRIAIKTNHQTPADDLMAAGVFGLMDALDAYDFDRGIKFETFAAHRVRGAILDELRAIDWVPRLVRSRTHKVQTVRDTMTAELGRQPTAREMAERLGLSMKEFDKVSRDVGIIGMVSLQQQIGDDHHDHPRDLHAADFVADGQQPDPLILAQKQELRDLILQSLSRIERLIVVLYYFEGMTMKEMSLTFDISESRICQLHSIILTKLRAEMRKLKLQPGAIDG